MTDRELVLQTIERRSPSRVPRMWGALPCAWAKYGDEIKALTERFPNAIVNPPALYRNPAPTEGDMWAIGTYRDEWGCPVENLQYGVIGEVKHPPVEDWSDTGRVHFPEEWMTLNRDMVNSVCRSSEKYMLASFTPRPFEQLQFIRGTEDLYCDLMDPEPEFLAFLGKMHDLYCRVMENWANTEVDSLCMQDDWGSQQQLLIPPRIWRSIFKPMYREYAEIAHAHGKKLHMHSDGQLIEILPDLIEIGMDTLNLQVFCIGLDRLRPYAGEVCFVGEIDRQYLLAYGTPAEVEEAVLAYQDALWKNGGAIAQLEFGPGARPENVERALEVWDRFRY